jgi:hypothetical protein
MVNYNMDQPMRANETMDEKLARWKRNNEAREKDERDWYYAQLKLMREFFEHNGWDWYLYVRVAHSRRVFKYLQESV